VTKPGAERVAWAIGDEATVQALALAGVLGRVAVSAAAARLALDEARAAGATLVVLTEQLASELDEAGLDEQGILPLLAVIPSLTAPRAQPPPGARRSRAVRRALGMPTDRTGTPP
jgi:vacuolar-type H+-ATPase subunit F/Vma7